jgi:preprotein translocase subunit SecF
MKKKKLNSIWGWFISIRFWYLIILVIISAAVCLFALRSNNEHMAVLRQNVYNADKSNGDVAGALTNLQKYVTSHMNTNLNSGANAVYPPIQLKYTYNRLVSQISGQDQSVNSAIYTQAENYCQTAIPNGFSGRYRVPCIEQYIQSHSLDQGKVNQSLYEFDFISPTWSPDLAGWSLVATMFILFLLLLNVSINYWEKRQKKSAS